MVLHTLGVNNFAEVAKGVGKDGIIVIVNLIALKHFLRQNYVVQDFKENEKDIVENPQRGKNYETWPRNNRLSM